MDVYSRSLAHLQRRTDEIRQKEPAASEAFRREIGRLSCGRKRSKFKKERLRELGRFQHALERTKSGLFLREAEKMVTEIKESETALERIDQEIDRELLGIYHSISATGELSDESCTRLNLRFAEWQEALKSIKSRKNALCGIFDALDSLERKMGEMAEIRHAELAPASDNKGGNGIFYPDFSGLSKEEMLILSQVLLSAATFRMLSHAPESMKLCCARVAACKIFRTQYPSPINLHNRGLINRLIRHPDALIGSSSSGLFIHRPVALACHAFRKLLEPDKASALESQRKLALNFDAIDRVVSSATDTGWRSGATFYALIAAQNIHAYLHKDIEQNGPLPKFFLLDFSKTLLTMCGFGIFKNPDEELADGNKLTIMASLMPLSDCLGLVYTRAEITALLDKAGFPASFLGLFPPLAFALEREDVKRRYEEIKPSDHLSRMGIGMFENGVEPPRKIVNELLNGLDRRSRRVIFKFLRK
jgi:hypothetical protein